MFNDDDSKRRTDQIHENLKRQISDRKTAEAARPPAPQRAPSAVRQQLNQYRRNTDR